MVNPLSLEELIELRGSPLIDRAGEEAGVIEDVYYDRDTRVPEWIAVSTSFSGKRVRVPVAHAEATRDMLRVPYDKVTIHATPAIDEREIDETVERQLYRHYGITYSERSSTSLLPDSVDVSIADTTGQGPSSADAASSFLVREPEHAADQPPGDVIASALEQESADLTPETAAPFPTLAPEAEPAAATSPENARPMPAQDAPGPPRLDIAERDRQRLADAPIVMTDMPADVPGTLYETTEPAPGRSRRTGLALPPPLAVAAMAVAALLTLRLLKSRRGTE